jgi:hypothetical protein
MGKLQDLKAELDGGHPVTGAYSGDAQVAADQINEKNRSRIVEISSAELLAWAGQASDGDRPRIIKIQEGKSNANEAVKALCITAEQLIMRDGTTLDLNLSDRSAMLDALVSGGVLSAADKTSLESLATRSISRAEELNLGGVKAGTIQQARA